MERSSIIKRGGLEEMEKIRSKVITAIEIRGHYG